MKDSIIIWIIKLFVAVRCFMRTNTGKKKKIFKGVVFIAGGGGYGGSGGGSGGGYGNGINSGMSSGMNMGGGNPNYTAFQIMTKRLSFGNLGQCIAV